MGRKSSAVRLTTWSTWLRLEEQLRLSDEAEKLIQSLEPSQFGGLWNSIEGVRTLVQEVNSLARLKQKHDSALGMAQALIPICELVSERVVEHARSLGYVLKPVQHVTLEVVRAKP